MPKITSLEKQKKNSDRLNVFLDGYFAFGISAEAAYLAKLKTGKEISAAEIKQLIEADQVERLVNKGLHFLGYRPRSEKEVWDHLTYKGKLNDLETEEEKKSYLSSIEKAIEKLRKLNYLNDTDFAKWWIDQRENFQKKSKRIIKSELLFKGIDKTLVEELLKEANNEEEKARQVAAKKAKLLSKLPKIEARAKLGQFLARRGYDWETIKKVVDSTL